MMDNKIFNINGESKERLQKTLELATNSTVEGWYVTEKGFILLWHADSKHLKHNKFPVPLDCNTITDIVWLWLQSEDSQKFKLIDGWDYDADHDGSNERGWRVYCEDWGHVGGDIYAMCAIVPAYMWYGK